MYRIKINHHWFDFQAVRQHILSMFYKITLQEKNQTNPHAGKKERVFGRMEAGTTDAATAFRLLTGEPWFRLAACRPSLADHLEKTQTINQCFAQPFDLIIQMYVFN